MRLLLPVLVVVLAACGDGGAPVCNRDTCAGCCDSNGFCQVGDQQSACGFDGYACAACTAEEQCSAGLCTPGTGGGGGSGGSGGGAAGGSMGGGAAGGAAGGSMGGGSGGGSAGGSGGTGGGAACVPENNAAFCSRRGAVCGPQTGTDNCGAQRSVASCGTCTSGQFCSNGACVCQPETNAQFCARQSTACGALSGMDNCGAARTVSCGTCTTPNTCTAGQCTCTPETDAQFCTRRGVSCGTATGTDNCGRSRSVASCGTCTGVNQCIGGSCSCPAESNAQFCARLGAQCGPLSGTDTCGNPRNVTSCGSCTGFNTCAGGGTANQCGCTPQTDAELCALSNTSCGSISATDRCGMARTVASCGACASGTRCPSTGPSNRSCQPFTCSSGQRACGQVCAPCPATGVATTTCGANDTCVAATCAVDFELQNGACVPATCPANQRSCGGACRACPTSGVTSTTCSGPACIAASCVDGQGVSGGQCVPMSCSAGSLFCSTACALCPTTGAATFGCDATVCSARTCAAGYTLNGRICIDSDWRYELIDANARRNNTTLRSNPIAIGPGGDVYVAYVTLQDLVVARRTGTNTWTTFRAAGYGGYDTHVMQLLVDGSGNAHVIYYVPGSGFSSIYSYNYMRLSPSGQVSMAIELGRAWSTGEIISGEIAMALDSNGDAHVTYDAVVNNQHRAKYRRTYQGAWLQAIEASTQASRTPAIFVEAGGSVVHIAGYASYTKGTNSIFTAPVPVSTNLYLEDTRLYLNGSTLELWGQSSGRWHWTALSTSTIAQPVQWYSGASLSGARGPNGVMTLEQATTNGPVTARSGPVTGPTLTEVTNLPLNRVVAGAVMDANGVFHAIAWNSSSTGLTYIRRN